MEDQKERDDLKRALAFLDGWRTRQGWFNDPDTLDRVLASVGMDFQQGRAMDALMRSVAREEADDE